MLAKPPHVSPGVSQRQRRRNALHKGSIKATTIAGSACIFPCAPVMLNSTLFLLFLAIAVPTVLTPGPGVLMSLTNSIRLGVARATPGILGVALGTLVVAGLSATGLGALLAASHTAYNIVKIVGILFMFYLGWKRWTAPATLMPAAHTLGQQEKTAPARLAVNPLRLFTEGIFLQFSNPQLIIFYVTLFPQCIDPKLPYAPQVIILALINAFLVWIIHSGYGWLGHRAAEHFMTAGAARFINRASALAFWGFASWLLYSVVSEMTN